MNARKPPNQVVVEGDVAHLFIDRRYGETHDETFVSGKKMRHGSFVSLDEAAAVAELARGQRAPH